MGYTLEAFLGEEEALSPLTTAFRSAIWFELREGYGLIPFTDELHDEFCTSALIEPFWKLPASVEDFIVGSCTGHIAYVEAESFGGGREQTAVAWLQGARSLAPVTSGHEVPLLDQAINRALRELGVDRDPGAVDEFDWLGLGLHRDTREWLERSV